MSTTPDSIPLEALAAALRTLGLGGRELWGYDEIAAYSKYARNYVANWVVVQPGFPTPIKVGGKGLPRYVASEVIAWFEAQRAN